MGLFDNTIKSLVEGTSSRITDLFFPDGNRPNIVNRPTSLKAASRLSNIYGGGSNVANFYYDFMEAARGRLERYDVYDAMDEQSDVHAVLDDYASDATQVDHDTKNVVWIEGDDQEIVDECTNLLHNILQVDDWAEGCCRDISKQGDDFGRLIYDESGITNITWLDPREVERIENRSGLLLGFEITENLENLLNAISKSGEVKPTLEPWDIIHFRRYVTKRVIGESVRNIYGTSILEASERPAKQVKVMDDILMITRLTRALDRYIYKIDVGNSAVTEAVQTMKMWMKALKRKVYIDPVEGKISSKFDPKSFTEDIFFPQRSDSKSDVETIPGIGNVCFAGDTKISLLDGREVTIKDAVDLHNNGEKLYVYSCSPQGDVTYGRAYPLLTYKNAPLVEVELDNGEKVKCTPNHKWLLREGYYKEAKDLVNGDSLMPLYRKLTTKTDSSMGLSGYERYYNPSTNRWRFTHLMVAREFYGPRFEWDVYTNSDDNVVHHESLNKRNNSPDQLTIMDKNEHTKLHGEYARELWKNEEYREKQLQSKSDYWNSDRSNEHRIQASEHMFEYNISDKHDEDMKLRWSDIRNKEQISKQMKMFYETDKGKEHRETLRQSMINYNKSEKHIESVSRNDITFDRVVDETIMYGFVYIKDLAEHLDCGVNTIRNRLRKSGMTWKELSLFVNGYYAVTNGGIRTELLNHKVVSVKRLNKKEDVYCMQVKNEHHNFALSAGVFVANTDAYDVDLMINKLFGSLRAMKGYYGYEGEANLANSNSAQSIKWSRNVSSIQKAFKVGITRICQIHLALKGMDTDTNNFTVMTVTPSNLELLERIEAYQAQIDVADRLVDLGEKLGFEKRNWADYIMRNILWFSSEEINMLLSTLEVGQEELGDVFSSVGGGLGGSEETPDIDLGEDEPVEEPAPGEPETEIVEPGEEM